MDLVPLQNLEGYLKQSLSDKIESTAVAFGELNITIKRNEILSVMKFLRDDKQCQFINIIDICGVDYPSRSDRFDVVYHLLSPQQNLRIRIKLHTDEETPVDSIYSIFPGAEWYEREAYDMFGILFTGNPDLRRILTDYGFEGHPLRKDFPTSGFVECRYDNETKRVIYEPVVLRQEMRNFDFLSPWEGTDYVLPGDEKAK